LCIYRLAHVLAGEYKPGGYYGLSGSPFTGYFVPSFILFVVVGGALGLAAVMLNRRHHRARAVTIAAAAVFFAWIVVQVAIIGYVSWMQPATFAAGLVMLLLMSLLPSSSEKAERF
jgi:peptidoglycan/LPS O-acetylase OafA/YrhL